MQWKVSKFYIKITKIPVVGAENIVFSDFCCVFAVESYGILQLPTVVDRTIEQAITQVLSPIFEPLFSDHSYGFRPKRSCEQAIRKLLEYFNEDCTWIVDIDLEKFFDNVPQDKLMSYVGRVIHDGDTESLIRKYLKAGVMVRGKYESTKVGTPQGGNLSPLLSNIMLNELDKELEKRELRFTRYADDCVIVSPSQLITCAVLLLSFCAKRDCTSMTDLHWGQVQVFAFLSTFKQKWPL